jgi:hypothetical protein
MSLETTLTDIIARLRQARFPNEQAISPEASSCACSRNWAGTRAVKHVLYSVFA